MPSKCKCVACDGQCTNECTWNLGFGQCETIQESLILITFLKVSSGVVVVSRADAAGHTARRRFS